MDGEKWSNSGKEVNIFFIAFSIFITLNNGLSVEKNYLFKKMPNKSSTLKFGRLDSIKINTMLL